MAQRPSTKSAIAVAALVALSACDSLMPSRPAVSVLPAPPPPPSAPMMAPALPAAPPPQMAPMATPAPTPAPAPRPASGALAGHLASYRTAESAQAGWQQLVRAQPALQTLKPYFLPATVNGQPWVRLLAGDFPNAEEVNRFCNWARAQRLYCQPMTVGANGQAMPAATAAPRQRQPRGTPQPAAPAPTPAPAAPAGQSMMMPAQPSAPPVATAPAVVAPPPPAPAQQVTNPAAQPPQPLAPPLPPRRQPGQPALPQ